jgi:uncharacterized membrane protein YjfL (UPF0719 family)
MRSTLPWVFRACFATTLIMVGVMLHRWGAAEVRADPGELIDVIFGGVVWLVLGILIFPWLGLSYRDDVAERGNVAALVALCGALMALGIIYAGGSIGEGPSYWENIFSAGLGTAGFLGLWIVLELGGQVSMSVTEERDIAAGLRLCGFLLATGLVLGRAVAGDWQSVTGTLHDFIRDGWPAAVLCAIAVPVERFARPSRRCPVPPWTSYGLMPALLYLALAAAWLVVLPAE